MIANTAMWDVTLNYCSQAKHYFDFEIALLFSQIKNILDNLILIDLRREAMHVSVDWVVRYEYRNKYW